MAIDQDRGAVFTPERHLEVVQGLTEQFEELPESEGKEIAGQLIAAVVELYGQGLERVMAALADAGPAGAAISERLADDGVVASLLLIHDLYPVDVETRVREALDTVRPYMESHGGDVEFLGVIDGVAHLRLEGHCKGCPASAATLELAIRQAIEEAAPELLGLDVQGVVEVLPGVPKANGIPLTMINAAGPALPLAPVAPAAPTWISLDAAADVQPGQLRAIILRGAAMVVANVDGTLLAYRGSCAGCGAALGQASLRGAVLVCEGCQRGFDLQRAGRGVDCDLQLTPVPLLMRAGSEVKVAVSV